MTETVEHFSTIEAAYLATACLASDTASATSAALRQALLRTALAWSPEEAAITERAVNKAIEEAILVAAPRTEARIDASAVLYLASTRSLEGVTLSRDAKRRLYDALRGLPPRSDTWRWVVAEGLYFAPGPRLGRWRALLRTYADDRRRHVASDPAIMGGAPVISGTRIPVHAVLARLEGGDTIDDLVADYPGVGRQPFEAAAVYARAHPRRGRPARRYR
jgi:uncharacterized protein (DUF433 family)